MNEGGSRNLLEGVKQNELVLVKEAMKQGGKVWLDYLANRLLKMDMTLSSF
jgi:hypothetical protein